MSPSSLGGSPQSDLIDTVVALRDEVAGLRAAARFRAVIEQAKGILVERHGIGLDEAFARLRAMSQEHNVRLVEVAATVVGVTLPDESWVGDPPGELIHDYVARSSASSGTWNALAAQPDVRRGVADAMLDTLAGSLQRGAAAAHLVRELLTGEGVAAVALYRPAPDGALRLVGQEGVPGDLMSSWRSIPPVIDVPYVRAVRENTCFFWGDEVARGRDFPASVGGNSAFHATATLPVTANNQVTGVVGLMWTTVEEFPTERRERLAERVQRVAAVVLGSVAPEDPELEWLNAVLALHLDPWLLLATVHGPQGRVRDFIVQEVAHQMHGGHEWLGRGLLELWPTATQDGTLEALGALARNGGSWTTTVTEASDMPWGEPASQVRAVRLGRRVVVVWRPSNRSS